MGKKGTSESIQLRRIGNRATNAITPQQAFRLYGGRGVTVIKYQPGGLFLLVPAATPRPEAHWARLQAQCPGRALDMAREADREELDMLSESLSGMFLAGTQGRPVNGRHQASA